MFFGAEHQGGIRPERTGRAERTERPERTGRTERTERSERTERTERTERPERSERTEEQSARNDRHIQMADCTVAEEIPTVSAAKLPAE